MAQKRTYLTGFREAREAMQEMSKAAQRGIGKRALKAGAQVLVDRLKQKTPVSQDKHDKTPGSLRDNTKVVDSRSEKGSPRVSVLINDVAAVPIEMGTTKMRARPYARNTERNARDEVGVRVGERLKIEVELAARRAARRAAKTTG